MPRTETSDTAAYSGLVSESTIVMVEENGTGTFSVSIYQKNMHYFIKPIILLLVFIANINIHAAPADIQFVSIPAGHYIMGTQVLDDAYIEIPPDNKIIIKDEQPAHRIYISAFEVGKFEITQGQWQTIMENKPGPDSHWQHPQWQQLPVVSVSWNMTQEFIKTLNEQDTQYNYRLPTEAEFEYLLRDGSNDLRPFEVEDMDQYAWTISNSADVPHPVGKLKPNSLGIYDTFGNAWEWVNDWYDPQAYEKHKKLNPQGPIKKTGKKVRRGGSYHCQSHIVRSGYRAADKSNQRYSVLGFRLVREKR